MTIFNYTKTVCCTKFTNILRLFAKETQQLNVKKYNLKANLNIRKQQMELPTLIKQHFEHFSF